MAQKTFVAGDVLSAADVNLYLGGEGGAWTSWTPAITQSGSVTATVTSARYGRWGRLIVAYFSLSVTGTGTAANVITVSLPVTAATSGNITSGSATLFDASVPATYPASIRLTTTTTMDFLSGLSGSSDTRLGVNTMTAALTTGDLIFGTVTYEAAS